MELALVLPILFILVLGAVDYAQVVSVKQRLEHAAHLAAVQLLAKPGQSVPANLAAYIQTESGLQGVTATATYTTAADGSDQVIVTAGYSYTLLMPGLRNLQTNTVGNGQMRVSVTQAGVAATNAPSVVEASPIITVTPPVAGSDATVPNGLSLTCSLLKDGVQVAHGACSAGSPLVWTNPAAGGSHTYTAFVSQTNAVNSPASAAVTGL